MALLFRAVAFLGGVGGTLLIVWLAFTNQLLAWVALLGAAVVAIGSIVLIARHTRRSMWAPSPASPPTQPAQPDAGPAGQPAGAAEEVPS